MEGHCGRAARDLSPLPRYGDRMDRTNVNTGSRAEILAELDQYGRDRHEQGNETKAREFARAHNAIEAGAAFVRVGSSVWYVAGVSLSDGEIAAAAVATLAPVAG